MDFKVFACCIRHKTDLRYDRLQGVALITTKFLAKSNKVVDEKNYDYYRATSFTARVLTLPS
jgi:hypothetical protein